jgi:hypothetical protein
MLSRVFRDKFRTGLKKAFHRKQLTFPGALAPLARERTFRSFLRSLFRQNWFVYAKPPFGVPQHVLHYLARYTHRVAISNHRIVAFSAGQVTFRWKDYAHGSKQKLLTVTAEEFLRRFLLHVLPPGFVRIRFFGFLASRRRKILLPLGRQLLRMAPPHSPESVQPDSCSSALWLCPRCGGTMLLLHRLTATELSSQSAKREIHLDSS